MLVLHLAEFHHEQRLSVICTTMNTFDIAFVVIWWAVVASSLHLFGVYVLPQSSVQTLCSGNTLRPPAGAKRSPLLVSQRRCHFASDATDNLKPSCIYPGGVLGERQWWGDGGAGLLETHGGLALPLHLAWMVRHVLVGRGAPNPSRRI